VLVYNILGLFYSKRGKVSYRRIQRTMNCEIASAMLAVSDFEASG
jgi:hypothetical protein